VDAGLRSKVDSFYETRHPHSPSPMSSLAMPFEGDYAGGP
jgi:hypothetical protein